MGSSLLRYRQENQMKKHFSSCNTKHKSTFVNSFRLIQEVKSKKVTKVHQIKCSGCGYSLDVAYEK